MLKNAYENAMARREKLMDEIAEIDRFLALYKKFDPENNPPTDNENSQQNRAKPSVDQVITKRRSLKRLKPKDIAKLAKDAIEKQGHPLTRGQLVTAIESLGYKIPSDDKARYVGTVMWRFKEQFENVENKGYWPRGVGPAKSDESSSVSH